MTVFYSGNRIATITLNIQTYVNTMWDCFTVVNA